MAGRKRFIIVFVVDGLRPDAITAEDTPTLHRLRAEGVDFANSHAAFPTVTRVNAAAISTACVRHRAYPARWRAGFFLNVIPSRDSRCQTA